MNPEPGGKLLGMLRRQYSIASEILDCYPIKPTRLRLISYETNFIYDVATHSRQSFVLRLAFPGWRSPGEAALEGAWLEALARETDITVPQFQATQEGSLVGQVGRRHAVLMVRLPGMLLGRRLTARNLTEMGELFAKMHLHAACWKPPEGLSAGVFDHYLGRGEPNALFSSARSVDYEPGDEAVVRRMSERVCAAYDSLDRSDLRVIHCDLWHNNIKIYRGKLAPFDFEDTIIGFRLHDIAMAMLDLAEETGAEKYGELLQAFCNGYETLLPWPEGEMEVLQMGRVLWRLNWIARNQPEHFRPAARFYADFFRRFEQTGRLSDPLRS